MDSEAKPSLTYANPLWGGYLADPFVIRWQGAYYAYGTGPVQPGGRCFPLLRSPDLVTWEHVGGALEPPAGLPEDSAYWAPAVAERDGTFYLYYSAAPPGDDTGHRLRVATAGHPAGPFVDTGRALLPESAGFAIDADPFRDPRDGRWYLFFATDFLDGERPGTGLAVVPLGDDMVTVEGEPVAALRASADWQIYQRNRPLYGRTWDAWHTVEGPCVLVGPDGRCYCLYSGGNWETPGYGVSFAVADHPLGPWREGGHGPVVLRGDPERGVIGPGHNSIVLAPDGVTPFVAYHAWDAARTARRMCIDPLLWTPDGPRCDGPSTGLRTAPLAGDEGSEG
jgi:arabinan endo-1,5-alpha-L-arabinosidase